MEYRRLGGTGLKVSEICMGTMTFGKGASRDEAKRMVDGALNAGVNFFDTADSYGGSQSESFLGRALKGRRRDVVVATKFFNPMGKGPNDSGMSRVRIMNAIEDSLSRLQMDHVDIFYIHHVDEQTPLDEMLRAMDDLVHQGKVRYIACSNYEAWRLAEALRISDVNNLARFNCYQPQYSLVVRDIEEELIPMCQLNGMGVVVWSPLAGGFLSGKYQPGQRKLSGSRSDEAWSFPDNYFAENADETLTELLKTAGNLGRSPAQVALRWVLEQPAISSVIVGARTLSQLEDNLKASGWHIETEALRRLNDISRLRERYPKSMEKQMRDRRDNAVQMPSL